jgi:beta-glucosidase
MRPVKELKGFEKVMIEAGATKTITFELDKKTFEFYAADETWKTEPGMFSIMIGTNSEDVTTIEFEIK